MSKPGIGDYLVDAKGMTLYYFTRDTINKSTAVGNALAAWPLFNPASFVVPPTLNAADFGTITREDGQKVATYKGWPLYYYVKDLAAGDVLGEGVGGVWFVIKVPFYNVMLETKAGIGDYLVDSKGMTLYLFTRDTSGKSNASAAVLANWPIFNVANFVAPSTLSVADFGTITRDDGQKMATYKGWPLYYYVNDKASGDTLGQGLNNVWYAVVPKSFPLPTLTITSPAAGDSVAAANVTVTAQVTNFNVVDKQGQANVSHEGHVHFYLDVDAPLAFDKPAIPTAGTWAHVSGLTYGFANVASGNHTITVQLVNNDHTPVVPPVVAKVTVTVPAPPGVTINLTARGFSFSPMIITVQAGAAVTMNFNNADSGIPHNFALYTNSSATTPIFVGRTITGSATTTYTFTAPSTPGTYFFRCDVHPGIMTGSLVVTAAGSTSSSSSGGGGGGGGGY